jgi:hypothetical protein
MEPSSRDNFLREVQPNIVQSLTDRYTILGGKKEYERRYDILLLLTPTVNVEFMIAQNNLPDCFEEWSEKDALAIISKAKVVHLRELYALGLFPFKQSELKEYKKQLVIKKGDRVVISEPGRDFGKCSEIFVPNYIEKCNIKVGDADANVYHMGIISHPVEFDIIVENLNFMMYLLSNAIDEFRDEVLERGNKMIAMSSVFVCASCSKAKSDEGRRVMIMHYISRSFVFPVIMSVLDWVCVFIREAIQRVDFVTQMLQFLLN